MHVVLTDRRIMTMTQKNVIRAKKVEPAKAKTALATRDGQLVEGEDNKYDVEELNKAIADIAKGVVRLDDQTQYVLVGISVQIVCKDEPIHGINLANDLLKAIGKRVVMNRRIIWWLTEYAPLKYVRNGKGETSEFKIHPDKLPQMKAEFQKDHRAYITERKNKPYSGEEFKEVKDAAKEFNFNAELRRLVDKATVIDKKIGQVATGKKPKNFDPSKVDLGIYEKIRTIVKELPTVALDYGSEAKPQQQKTADTGGDISGVIEHAA